MIQQTSTYNRMIGLFVCAVFTNCVGVLPTFGEVHECAERGGLSNVLAKLETGKTVRIAYLGGSITSQPGWRPLTTDWFRQEWPNSHITEVDASIGGTGSELGVFRIDRDVLVHHPDLLFVEFAVNDSECPPQQICETMEGIVRKTWKANPQTDLCFVYTLKQSMLDTLQRGQLVPSMEAMEKIAKHYDIPTINMGAEVAMLEGDGKLLFRGSRPATIEQEKKLGGRAIFSPDGVHPYVDSGHKLYFDAVARSMNQIRKLEISPKQHFLKAAYTDDPWEDATLVPIGRVSLSDGWRKLSVDSSALAKQFQALLPEMYFAENPGETISFNFKGTRVQIYDLLGPNCGQVIIRVDNRPPKTLPRFDHYTTYHRLGALPVGTNLNDGNHSVTLTIHSKQADKRSILAELGKEIDDPKRFDGTAWYVGAVLVRGHLLE